MISILGNKADRRSLRDAFVQEVDIGLLNGVMSKTIFQVILSWNAVAFELCVASKKYRTFFYTDKKTLIVFLNPSPKSRSVNVESIVIVNLCPLGFYWLLLACRWELDLLKLLERHLPGIKIKFAPLRRLMYSLVLFLISGRSYQ